MIFMIKYKREWDVVDIRSSFYAENEKQPDWEKVVNLVNLVSGGNFAEGTIEIEYLEFEAEEMRKQGVQLHRFDN